MATERLRLRRLTSADRGALLDVLGDPDTMVHYPRPFDAAAVDAWIARAEASYAEHGYGLYAVERRDDGAFLGDCGFLVQRVDGQPATELAYHFARRHWGRGYATEAARACREYAFGALGLARLVSLILPANDASRRVAERVGLRRAGTALHAGLAHDVFALSADGA